MNKRLYSTAFVFIFFTIIFIMGVTYVSWRWLFTLNVYTSPLTTFWSYALCAAEILTLIVFTNFALILLSANRLEKVVPDNKLQQDYYKDVYNENGELVTFKNFCPSVAIFICTLNEEADMLSTTISACKNIDYPNFKVYVLDDGKRAEIKELSELLGCNYITRDTNKGYKSGNINNALLKTESDLVVIFDADHIPVSTFLRETVYNFADKNVALVQTPQYFCNPDAFQKNLGMQDFLSNEQDIFYRVIEPSLNELGCVFCGGTNIVIDRKHLESVGNFNENTITEDSLLGLMFHSKKYKVVYYNRPIAIGIAASSFEEYIKQRIRWAKGNVQIITTLSNWKYYTKLSAMQTFLYLSAVLYFFTPIARIIFLIAPVLFLFFDITPVLVLFYQIVAFQICYFGLKFLFIYAARIRINNIILADVYDLVTSMFTIGGILKTLFVPSALSKLKFTVTKKSFTKSQTKMGYKMPVVIMFSILVLAQLRGIYDLLFSDVYSVLAIVANLFWNTINIVTMIFALKVVSEKPEKRMYQRIKTNNELMMKDVKNHIYKSIVEDISRSGVKFSVPKDLQNNSSYKADIQGEEDNEMELIGCEPNKGHFTCKTVFKKPIALYKLAKRYVKRIDNYVKFAYKKSDTWDYDNEKPRKVKGKL